MDVKFLKYTAFYCFAFMMVIITISILTAKSSESIIYANVAEKLDAGVLAGSQTEDGQEKKQNSMPTTKAENVRNGNILELTSEQELGSKYIKIKKAKDSFQGIQLEDLYMNKSIRIVITGSKEQDLDESSLILVNQNNQYTGTVAPSKGKDTSQTVEETGKEDGQTVEETGKIAGQTVGEAGKEKSQTIEEAGKEESQTVEEAGKEDGQTVEAGNEESQTVEEAGKEESQAVEDGEDPVKEYTLHCSKEENTSLYTQVLTIRLDQIYACILYQDEDNIYIDLRKPKDVYKKIVVIDSGHGGKDCGTFSKGEEYYEKDINLSVVLHLKELLDQENIKVYYTRTKDTTVYLNPRVNLANEVGADFFISIHCNSNRSSKPNGTQVLYSCQGEDDSSASKELAKICLDEVVKVTNKDMGLVPGDRILIVHKAKVPVALVELAFMSNDEDMNFLKQDTHRREIARALYEAILKAYEKMRP